MKKVLIPIITFVLGICVTVGANILYKAEDVSYKDTNVQEAMEEMFDSFSNTEAVLLWTNSNVGPEIGFNDSRINLDLSQYEYIIMDAFHSTAGLAGIGVYNFEQMKNIEGLEKQLFKIGDINKRLTGAFEKSIGNNNVTFRYISVDKNGITIDSTGTYSNGSDVRYAIPYHVWGLKRLSFN